MPTLTDRQQQVLDVIRAYLQAQGRPPTRQEIAQALGMRSVNAAVNHLKALAKKGYIEMLPGRNHRNIRLCAIAMQESGLPLVGRVAAGAPILAEQNIEMYFQSTEDLFAARADYLLRVQGMSMRDAGIEDGDLLAVRRTPIAEDGQIVVARVDDEVTVKRLRRAQGQISLWPENSDFKPIVIDPQRQELVIEGIGLGVIRQLH